MITNSKLVFNIKEKKTKKQILTLISKKLESEGIASSAKEVLKGFEERENQTSTGMSDGIAIPHVSSSAISEVKIVVAKLAESVNWPALDGKKTDYVIAIAVPNSGRDDHFELLTQITGKLGNPDFIKELKKMSLSKTVNFINDFKVSKKKNIKNKSGKKIVAVTTCPVGIAHTFMAAEAVEKAAIEAGYQIKVEKQAAIGTKDKLSAKDIVEADYVILVAGKEIEGRERFNGKVGAEWTHVGKSIKEASTLVEEATKTPKSFGTKGKGGSITIDTGSIQKPGLLSHMMSGLSYMIPFVVVGGILIAVTIGIGYNPSASGMIPKNNWFGEWMASLNFVGAQAFGLMIPILAMFIANSIAGRSAIAPAAILAFAFNSGGGEAVWNWGFGADSMGFGAFSQSPALGFLGAIVFGYCVGFAVKLFNSVVEAPKWLAPAMPIFFIPIGATLLFWAIFAFIGYLPLYAIALSLNWLLGLIKEAGLMFLLGVIIGAMISFDMGGPINKIAFAFGVATIGSIADSTNGGSAIMGIVSTSIPVAPIGSAIGVGLGSIFKVDFDEEDKTNASAAGLMGIIGISEGAIPFAIKFPKVQFIANVTGGAVAGMLAAIIGITSIAAHGGPIVGFVGGISTTWNASIWVALIIYLIIILIGSLVTALIMVFGIKFDQVRLSKLEAKEKALEA